MISQYVCSLRLLTSALRAYLLGLIHFHGPGVDFSNASRISAIFFSRSEVCCCSAITEVTPCSFFLFIKVPSHFGRQLVLLDHRVVLFSPDGHYGKRIPKYPYQ